MTRLRELREQWAISCLVPDLPATVDIIPYLQEIDKNRWYSNFGPLQREFENVQLLSYLEPWAHDYSLFYDPIHMNPKGQKMVTLQLIKDLKKVKGE